MSAHDWIGAAMLIALAVLAVVCSMYALWRDGSARVEQSLRSLPHPHDRPTRPLSQHDFDESERLLKEALK